MLKRAIFLFLISSSLFLNRSLAQTYKVLESNQNYQKVELDFSDAYRISDTTVEGRTYQVITGRDISLREKGEPWLPVYTINIALQNEASPKIQVLQTEQKRLTNKFIIPFQIKDPLEGLDVTSIDREIYSTNRFFPQSPAEITKVYTMRYAHILPVKISPYQFNPVSRELIFNKKMVIRIDLNSTSALTNQVNDPLTEKYLKSSVINKQEAFGWKKSRFSSATTFNADTFWYNPAHDYYKIYINKKGIYRLSFDTLAYLGIHPGQGTPCSKIAVFNEGKQIPLEIVDNGDQIFNSGDYIQFVGFPPTASPYTYQNLYNLENVYWLTFQNDLEPVRYVNSNGYPNSWTRVIQSSRETLHYEKDSIYERLGHASNGKRDYWFWGSAAGTNGNPEGAFVGRFNSMANWLPDSNYITVRVKLHGITNPAIYPDHNISLLINGKEAGNIVWDDQTEYLYEKKIKIGGEGGFNIWPEMNSFEIWASGNIPPNPYDPSAARSDIVRVNWFEIDYWREHRVNGKYMSFKNSSENWGPAVYSLYSWKGQDMKIYIPERNKLIANPRMLQNQYDEVLFTDTVYASSEYFCASGDYYNFPDSMIKDIPSYLHSTSNEADYIIITHANFKPAAIRLAEFRKNHIAGIENPRIKIVDIQEIYDEFSAGLEDPYAIKSFIKYAFENWSGTAPAYVVLLGDMSYDYRKLIKGSRPNFIPSIPYHQGTYGQTVSDNLFVAVSGNDIVPDLAIGRLSCETLAEADLLVDKIKNYPGDNSKEWKENVLFIAAGQGASDEQENGFNDKTMLMDKNFVLPNGFTSEKIMLFPSKPEYKQFQGDREKAREGFNHGAVLANFFGHGGGYQWDALFLNEDIYILKNSSRLPVITSITCYTAHFDNQNVFGEQFIKAPGQGSIGFIGFPSLAYFADAERLNRRIHNQIFVNKRFVMGDAFMFGKADGYIPGAYSDDHISLLTYLGDPALELAFPKLPDFAIKSSDIVIDKQAPQINDTINVKVKLANYGIVFPDDSATVQIYAASSDTSYLIGSTKIGSFGQNDSVSFAWVPKKAALYTIRAEINESQSIKEDDHSDNIAQNIFSVFNLSEPSIISPLNAYVSNSGKINFVIADIGSYLGKSINYSIQIDTVGDFNNPVIQQDNLIATDGIISWQSPELRKGIYFWRTRNHDGQLFSPWTSLQTFSVTDQSSSSYFLYGRQLSTLKLDNVYYKDSLKSLVLNTSINTPRPSDAMFLEDIPVTLPDSSKGMSTITTDGKYIYFAHLLYYGGPSYIYRMGTGYNNTEKGKIELLSDKKVKISNQMFYHTDGHIYISTDDPYSLLRMNKNTGDTSRVSIPSGMLNCLSGRENIGSHYVTSDGRYVYNLAYYDSTGSKKYTIRVFDPDNNWKKVKDVTSLGSYIGFSNFFVMGGYAFPYENYESGFMRRIDLNTGEFDKEWLTRSVFMGYYAWAYDQVNDVVYASVFRQGKEPRITKFRGTYKEASGSITSNEIGPASKFKNISYKIDDTNSLGKYTACLHGFNSVTKLWDTLKVTTHQDIPLDTLNSRYSKLKLFFRMVDSSFGATEPLKLKNISAEFKGLPEVTLSDHLLTITPDSLMQGFPVTMNFKARNIGFKEATNLKLQFFMNDADSAFLTRTVTIPADSSRDVRYTISTDKLLFSNKIKVTAQMDDQEYYTFNNIAVKRFFVARDSVNPNFNITFDGLEILNGDIISANPEIIMTLKDNSPLPLNDTSYFYITHTAGNNYRQISFKDDSLDFQYTSYPNSQATIKWHPKFNNGDHSLDVFAKDASGNFFDSTSFRINFVVNTNNDITDLYNYPNPFKEDTYFTFNITGQDLPYQMDIKIFTVAGRKIRDISVPVSSLQFGFNKIYWDGRDQDGNSLANGVYFYKIVMRNKNLYKTIIQKLAKIK